MGHADCTPSLAQAIKMKSFSREGKLSEAVIRSIMAEEKPNQKEQFRIPKERISKYFKPGTPARTMEDTITESGSGRWNAESSTQGKVCPSDGPCAGAGFAASPSPHLTPLPTGCTG